MPLGSLTTNRACTKGEADCAKPAAVCCGRVNVGGCGEELAETRKEVNPDARNSNACSD